MSRERRIHPRTETRIRSTLRCGDATIDGVVENVGAGGVFFSTGDLEAAVDVGSAVVITLQDGDEAEIEQNGVVLRTERYFDGSDVRRSFAVKFETEIDVGSVATGA